jgi:predicted ATPase
MIEHLSLQNFKSLKHLSVDFKKLNLLVGINSSGKSSLIQALLALRQSFNARDGHKILYTNYPEISFSRLGSPRDVFYEYGEGNHIHMCLRFSGSLVVLERNYRYNPDKPYFIDENVKESINYYEFRDAFQSQSLFTQEQFQYLQTHRLPPRFEHEGNTMYGHLQNRELGSRGEATIAYLNMYGTRSVVREQLWNPSAINAKLIHQTNAWLGLVSPGVELDLSELPGAEKILLRFKFKLGKDRLVSEPQKPQHVGFGLSYVLPVIVSLLMAEPGRLIIIENPEAHLHPRGQAELGNLIARAAAAGAQLFIETHSDHIINGIRVAVKEGVLDEKQAQILFFDRITTETEQYSKVTPIYFDKQGELSSYPIGFLDEWGNQLSKIMF